MRIRYHGSWRGWARAKVSGTPYSTYSSMLAPGVASGVSSPISWYMLAAMPPAHSNMPTASASQPTRASLPRIRHRQANAASSGAPVRKEKDNTSAWPGSNARAIAWHSRYNAANTAAMRSPVRMRCWPTLPHLR
ncbi:hypothetical protein D3C72_1248870 [compost metagenome]